MSKSQTKSNKVVTVNSIYKRVENSWILLAQDLLLENSYFNIITLPHPSHGKPAKYVLDDTHKKVFEVVTFNEPHRSWFIGETVKSDGSIQIITPMNPVFLVLPRLKKQCSNRAVPLEDLLAEKGFDKLLEFINNLDNVADLKGPKDMKAYKYNEEKTLEWLKERVSRVAKVLRDKNIHVTAGAVSSTFVTSNVSNESIEEEFYLKYAFGIISEYLQEDLANMLEKKFDFKPELVESVGKKRKSEVDSKDYIKKMKCDNSVDDSQNGQMDITAQKSPVIKKLKPLSAKEKARQKAASGTKTISAFFQKK